MMQDPKTLAIALLGGITPAFLWLWFWLKEDDKEKEPLALLSIIFIVGMLSVFFVLPIQKFIQAHIYSPEWRIIYWAGAEELIKLLAAVAIVWKSSYVDEPIDWPIYLITAALGFAALENAMFLLRPLSLDQTTVSLLTGQLRFLGATLLHTVTSGAIGVAIGLAFSMSPFFKKVYLFFGFVVSVALHSLFNFFIIRNSGGDFMKVFAFLWVVTIIMMLLLEKLRRMSFELKKDFTQLT